MGFRKMVDYTEQKYGNWFRLQNDNDYADVIFLYQGVPDVMYADTHYVKTDGYSGYVCCNGKGCPVCAKGIRVQPKLFIPMFVLQNTSSGSQTGRVQFWDRTPRFQPQLINDVFRNYPNPSEVIFRITRKGAAGDINTVYQIQAIGNNTDPNNTYDGICSRFGVRFPDYYDTVCKDMDNFALSNLLTASAESEGSRYSGGASASYTNNSGGYNSYNAVPRSAYPSDPGMIAGTQIPLTSDADNLSMPQVSLNTPVPSAAPPASAPPFDPSSVSWAGSSDSEALAGESNNTNYAETDLDSEVVF